MKKFKFLHRWLGIFAALFIILFAISGIVLNHRSFFSGIDINRKYLPQAYRYHNWNQSAVKSAIPLGKDSLLLYGNIGIWLSDSLLSQFQPYHSGIKNSADNRRTSRIIKTQSGDVLAGTMSGLYHLSEGSWKSILLPTDEKRITGITENSDGVWAVTRSNLVHLTKNNNQFQATASPLPFPTDFKRETTMFRALWVIHSGKILGLPGTLLVDAMGMVMIFLSLTGIVWFIAPDVIKSLKNRIAARKRFAKINRFSLSWHNKLGIWTVLVLILMTLTGMFLRPPLLIPIVRESFPAIKHTLLDHPNPWYDKLRDIQYNRKTGDFIISTSEGFYSSEPTFTDSLKPFRYQPPISVMGINVFEQPRDGEFITGSFSGIHRWNPSENLIYDFITGLPVTPAGGMVNPFGSIPVAGYIPHAELLFDYNAGVFTLKRTTRVPAMPDYVAEKSPMSLWNLALEVHTGRIYSVFLGDFYILFIPLIGLFILIILISGGVLWLRNHRRKARIKTKNDHIKSSQV